MLAVRVDQVSKRLPVAVTEWLARLRGLPIKSGILPLLKHARGKWLAAMLAAKRSAGVAPELYLREHVTCTPLPSSNKVAHFGTQRCHQKSKIGVSVDPQKDLKNQCFLSDVTICVAMASVEIGTENNRNADPCRGWCDTDPHRGDVDRTREDLIHLDLNNHNGSVFVFF